MHLCADILFINGLPFLSTISKKIKYRTIEWLPNRTPSAYRSAFDKVFRIYNKAGFTITYVHADQEFKPIFNDIQDDLGITLNSASAQEHVPEAERNNRTIKERFRAMYHRLPYTNLPKVMIKYGAMEAAAKLNYFPTIGNISSYYSPRVIMTQQPLDFNKHCSIPFGVYV